MKLRELNSARANNLYHTFLGNCNYYKARTHPKTIKEWAKLSGICETHIRKVVKQLIKHNFVIQHGKSGVYVFGLPYVKLSILEDRIMNDDHSALEPYRELTQKLGIDKK